MNDVTRIPSQVNDGDPAAADQLLPLVYAELRQLAAAKLAHEKPGQTLQATALVHEAYLRLVDQTTPQQWDNSRHFFAAAAESMRRILIERARQKQSLKGGGGHQRVDLDAVVPAVLPMACGDLLGLDEAIRKLERQDPRKAELVKLRFFAGLTTAQAYLNNKPVVARRPSAAYRLRKFVRRNRVAVATTGVIAMCLLLIGCLFVDSYTQQHRLLRELQDEAFANALWGAMSAQSNADVLIQRAEDVGVSDDRILMLRGQRHLYGGDPADAVKYLEKARQLRQSLMAQGMLVVAYHFSGDMDKWLTGVMQIRDLDTTNEEPSPEDLLFWAQATCVLVDPDKVLNRLNVSMSERIYPLSLVVRAETLIWRAIHGGQMADAQEALEYIAAAEKIMPDNPYLLHMTILANYIGDIIDPDRKPLAERIAFAHQLAEQILRDFPNYPHARVFAASYLDFLGETDEAVRQFKSIRVRNPSNASYYASCAGMTLFRCGRWDEAHGEIAEMPPTPSKAMVAPALLDTVEGRRQCDELFAELADAYDRGECPGESNAASIASIMLLLGNPQEAESRARGWLPRQRSPVPAVVARNWGDSGIAQLKFVAGEIGEQDLLEAAAWSKLTQSAAYYLCGVRHLAYGRRGEAKESFRQAGAYPAYWFTTCPMGMGLLRRMEADPTWPDWIESRD